MNSYKNGHKNHTVRPMLDGELGKPLLCFNDLTTSQGSS